MKFLIIGNGVAGNSAAHMIRRNDRASEIALISDQPHAFYTPCALPHYLAGEIEKKGLFVKTAADYAKDEVEFVAGQKVVSIKPDEKKVHVDGSTSLDYDRLIIATGSRPVLPPIAGITLQGVHTFKYLDDAVTILDDLPGSAVIVGTGPIGIEAGIALTKRGVKVHLIEMMGRIMPRIFDDGPASMVSAILQEHGMESYIGERVERIIGARRVEAIATDKRTIPCDVVIMAAGMRPNSELAKDAGIGVAARGGIVTDPRMATTLPDIYACGDCVEAADFITGAPGMIQLWHNAREQGEIAGANAAGRSTTFAGSINITSLDVFDRHAVSFGNTHADLAQQEDVELIEDSHDGGYHRLILKQGQVVGAQFIGDVADMGAVLYALIRKDRLAGLKEFGSGRPTMATLLHNYRLSPFLRAGAFGASPRQRAS